MPNAQRCQWRLLQSRCHRVARGRLRFGRRVCDEHRDSIFQVKGETATWIGGQVSSDHLLWAVKVVQGVYRVTGYAPTSIKFRKSDGGECWARYHLLVPSKGQKGRMILLHEIAHGLEWGDEHGKKFYARLFRLGRRWLPKAEQAALVEDELMYKPKGATAAVKRLKIQVETEDVTFPEK